MKEYRLNMYGKHALNADDSHAHVAQAIEALNTAENLRSIIKNKEAIIMSAQVDDGTDIVLLHPSGPYTDRALMLSAYNEKIKPVNLKGEERRTHWIYDYSEKAQEQYWDLVVAGLKSGRKILEEEGRAEKVTNKYVENSTHISNHKYRTSRTILFPHGHFVEIDPDILQETTHVLGHLREERSFLLFESSLFERFITRVKNNIEYPNLGINIRDKYPLGYEFNISSDNISDFAKLMKNHHQAYEEVYDYYLKKANNAAGIFDITLGFKERLDKVIEPPSYRLYIDLNDNNLNVSVSPEFISHAGAMQGLGINLDRSPEHSLRVTKEERVKFAQKFADYMILG